MNRNTILHVFAAFALVACSKGHHGSEIAGDTSDPSIDFVKGQPSSTQGLTYGQVLDNSPNCSARQWTVAKDKYGRDLVTFRCNVTVAKDRLDQLRHDAIPMVENNTRSSGANCPDLAKAYLAVAVQKVNDYFDRFTSGTEVMEFVVNQGEIVETRAGLNDKEGQALTLSSYAISLVVNDLQATGDGQRGMEHLLAILRDKAPYVVGDCAEMSRGVPNIPNVPANSGTTVPQAASAGSSGEPAGDAEPEPKGD